MKFRTELKPERFPFSLDPKRPVITLGSCFADNISERMRRAMWTAENPFGTLFNPISVSSAIRLALANDADTYKDTLFRDSAGTVHSWAFGSVFSATEEAESCGLFTRQADRFNGLLTDSEVLFVTFGTAFVYKLAGGANDYVVGNCHKEPAERFSRARLTVDEVVDEWTETIQLLRSINRSLKVVFTVSPVRHKKDGLHANTLSKAILHLAVERLCSSISDVYYFPAYELLIDDLRDYRFFAGDLVHPSEAAIEYIWEYFRETLLDKEGEEQVRLGEKEYKRLNHRPIIQNNL